MGQLTSVRKFYDDPFEHPAEGLHRSLARKLGSKNKATAVMVGGLGGLVVGSEVAQRKIGSNRYKAGKHVQDGFFQGPGVNRGYLAAERKDKGRQYGSKSTTPNGEPIGMRVNKSDSVHKASPAVLGGFNRLRFSQNPVVAGRAKAGVNRHANQPFKLTSGDRANDWKSTVDAKQATAMNRVGQPTSTTSARHPAFPGLMNRSRFGKSAEDAWLRDKDANPSRTLSEQARQRKAIEEARAARNKNARLSTKVKGAVRGFVGKADRDQNSLRAPVATTTHGLHIPNKAGNTTAQTRSGSFAGKTRGVGRHLTRDQNSTPGSTIVRTPRGPSGQFVSHDNDLKVFHPQRYGSNHRQARDSRVGHWVKGRDNQAKAFIGKADDGRKVLAPIDQASLLPHTGARVGRRL